MGDYMCRSAPVDDPGNRRCEGVIYERCADPMNKEGKMCLYAPDITVGADGRYYLYYVLDKSSVTSVTVCDVPAGKYEFYGYVHYHYGIRLGEREGDEPQFDPGVLTEGEKHIFTAASAAKETKAGRVPGQPFWTRICLRYLRSPLPSFPAANTVSAPILRGTLSLRLHLSARSVKGIA